MLGVVMGPSSSVGKTPLGSPEKKSFGRTTQSNNSAKPLLSYWYNPADLTMQKDPTDFPTEWHKRMRRSVWQARQGNLETHWDPLTSQHFNYHPVSDTFS